MESKKSNGSGQEKEYVCVNMEDLRALLDEKLEETGRAPHTVPEGAQTGDGVKPQEQKNGGFGEEGEYTIDIKMALVAVLKRWWLILLATLIGGFAMLAIGRYQYTPTYSTAIQFYVNNTTGGTGNIKDYITVADLGASQSLIETYDVILNTRAMLDQVDAALQAKYNYSLGYATLRSMLTSGAVGDTPIFAVRVTSTNPEQAIEVANTIVELLPTQLANIVEGSSARIVESATTASLIQPDYSSGVVTGALVGFLLAVAYSVLVGGILNDKLENPKWLSDCFPSIPVLAQIPDTTQGSGSPGYGYYGYYGYGYGYGYSYGYGSRKSKPVKAVSGEKARQAEAGEEKDPDSSQQQEQ